MKSSRCVALLVVAALAVGALLATQGKTVAHTGVFVHATVASGGHHAIPAGAAVEVLCQLTGTADPETGDTLSFRVAYQGRDVMVPASHTDSGHVVGQPPLPDLPMCGGPGPAPVVQPAAPLRPGAQARETVKPA